MGVILFFAMLFGMIIIITLGSVWMGTSYYAKKKGLVKGTTRREIEQVQQDISQIRVDIAELREQIADLITINRDSL